jgi:uncharacterized protein (DUF2147 family)
MKLVIYNLILYFLAIQLSGNACIAQVKADDITGIWLTAGKQPAKIQIYKSGEQYFGKITWLQNPTDNGKPKVDKKNPEENKRNTPIIGLVILRGFKFDGDDEWESGKIYDPESGKTYSCFISLKDKNTMKVRGYVGISLLGRTEIWTRSTL